MIYDSRMPRYLVVHHAPGVTPEQFQQNVPTVLEGKFATFVQCYANLVDGLILNIYDGDSEQAVAREMERVGFPFDEIKEQQFAASFGDLKKMAGG
jgi:Nickel responsive protein SCO4226-like